jgi:hypothetical protein
MSDFNSSLPIRTENDGDVVIKVADATTPSQQLTINSDGSVNITDNGGSITVDGSVDVTATNLDIRDLDASQDNVAISDGTDSLAINSDGSINVVTASPVGIASYSTASAIAGGATSNHDYTTTGDFKLTNVSASSSGKMKIEVQIETAASSGTFNSFEVQFSSTANPNMLALFNPPLSVSNGAKVRVIRTNKEGSSTDLYSTIKGYNS